MASRLELTRQQILAFRRRVGGLDGRSPKTRDSLRLAAWAGLQDSMPRAALLSLHARIEEVDSATWEDPSLAQLWGPRYSTYVVAKRDFALFSQGRLPEPGKSRDRAERIAAQVHVVRIETWERLSRRAREAVEAEAAGLPLPGLDRPIEVFWNP